MKKKLQYWVVEDPSQLASIMEDFKNLLTGKKVILFYGELGAGKTTIIKAFCEYIGVLDEVSSPTFALVNEYRLSGELLLYHIDLYRLNSLDEAMEIGIHEYIYSGEYCLIEWPQLIEPLVAEIPHAEVHIEPESGSVRKVLLLST